MPPRAEKSESRTLDFSGCSFVSIAVAVKTESVNKLHVRNTRLRILVHTTMRDVHFPLNASDFLIRVRSLPRFAFDLIARTNLTPAKNRNQKYRILVAAIDYEVIVNLHIRNRIRSRALSFLLLSAPFYYPRDYPSHLRRQARTTVEKDVDGWRRLPRRPSKSIVGARKLL